MTNGDQVLRIGHGYDVHAFEPGDHVVLGGVRIPHDQALKAHSDGDVLLHALTDALLGAAALGDIGRHFPDTDMAFKDADSRQLLKQAYAKLREKGCRCISADMTVVAERPKMGQWIPQILDNISADLELDVGRINVKATTSEQLGFCGREEGIAAYAVVLLDETESD